MHASNILTSLSSLPPLPTPFLSFLPSQSISGNGTNSKKEEDNNSRREEASRTGRTSTSEVHHGPGHFKWIYELMSHCTTHFNIFNHSHPFPSLPIPSHPSLSLPIPPCPSLSLPVPPYPSLSLPIPPYHSLSLPTPLLSSPSLPFLLYKKIDIRKTCRALRDKLTNHFWEHKLMDHFPSHYLLHESKFTKV